MVKKALSEKTSWRSLRPVSQSDKGLIKGYKVVCFHWLLILLKSMKHQAVSVTHYVLIPEDEYKRLLPSPSMERNVPTHSDDGDDEDYADGERVTVKDAWSGVVEVGVGVIKGSFQKHLKTGDGQGKKLFVEERGFRRCHHPCPLENFNHTLYYPQHFGDL